MAKGMEYCKDDSERAAIRSAQAEVRATIERNRNREKNMGKSMFPFKEARKKALEQIATETSNDKPAKAVQETPELAPEPVKEGPVKRLNLNGVTEPPKVSLQPQNPYPQPK